ncbi:hypothetical protein GCM10029992_26170 [Glycomyces albus]
MKLSEQGLAQLLMGRRSFVTRAAALSAGVGLSAAALSSCDDDEKDPDISLRDQDLPFIGTEETFSTPELLMLNSINEDHIAFLEEIGLSDLGERRIGDMDEGASTFKSSLRIRRLYRMSRGKMASTLPIVSTDGL